MNNSDIAAGARFDEEAAWFRETMDRLKGTYQYLVVFMHKSVYGSDFVDEAVAQNIRPQWAPIFQQYQVDLVLSGHDHIFSRTNPMEGGTFYLDMGSSGDKKRRPDSTMLENKTRYAKVIDLIDEGISCASNIEVDARQMRVSVYDQYAQVIDRFTIPARRTTFCRVR